jgi:hypothetical protein
LIGSLSKRIAQLIEGDLETAPNGSIWDPEPARDRCTAVAFDEMQQDRRSVRFGKREDFVRDGALQFDLLDDLGRRSHRTSIVVRDLALSTSRLAPAPRVDEVLDDTCEPWPDRLIDVYVGLPIGSYEPGLLSHVVGKRCVLEESPCELAHPAHLGQELLARRCPRVVHACFQQLSAAARRIVHEKVRSGCEMPNPNPVPTSTSANIPPEYLRRQSRVEKLPFVSCDL